MTGEIWDYPTRIRVTSESDINDSYLVDLTDFPVNGIFNGSCQCQHFVCVLRPKIKTPGNTFLHRCKHLRWARDHALDFILPHLKAADPNIPEDQQP